MKRWSLTQWVGVVLGSVCGLLMLLMLLQRLGLGTTPAPLDELVEPLDMALLAPLKQSRHALPPDAHYALIAQRPLFNNDRRPRVLQTAPVATKVEPPIMPLNATLTGTIVTNGRRLALVRDNTSSKVVVMKPGMPLPGELMGWKLVSVDERSAIFDGGATQGRSELKLDVSKNTGPAPTPPPAPEQVPPPAQPGQAQAPVAQVPSSADQAAKEEEVRRIIEERRAQMRAEAAKMGGN